MKSNKMLLSPFGGVKYPFTAQHYLKKVEIDDDINEEFRGLRLGGHAYGLS
jgi:hypothetical protein